MHEAFGQLELLISTDFRNWKVKLDFTLGSSDVLKDQACVSRSLIRFVGFVVLPHLLSSARYSAAASNLCASVLH